MSNYSELLKDPRWQKKRLEIMERDGWQCQTCHSKTKTLNIHHMKYSGKPWEAKDFQLITLCEDCHKDEERLLSRIPTVVKAFNDEGIPTAFIGDLLVVAMQYVDSVKNSKRLRPEVIEGSRANMARFKELVSIIQTEIEQGR